MQKTAILTITSFYHQNALLMANETSFLFRREALQALLDTGTDIVVINSRLEEDTLQDGTQAGVLRVWAEARNRGEEKSILTVDGCPIPPCKT